MKKNRMMFFGLVFFLLIFACSKTEIITGFVNRYIQNYIKWWLQSESKLNISYQDSHGNMKKYSTICKYYFISQYRTINDCDSTECYYWMMKSNDENLMLKTDVITSAYYKGFNFYVKDSTSLTSDTTYSFQLVILPNDSIYQSSYQKYYKKLILNGFEFQDCFELNGGVTNNYSKKLIYSRIDGILYFEAPNNQKFTYIK